MVTTKCRFLLVIGLSLLLSGLYYLYVQKRAIVDLLITASTDTNLKIYWTGVNGLFSEKNSSKALVHTGTRHYRIRIGNLADITAIRIDTSDRNRATVRIRTMEISQYGFGTLSYSTPEKFVQLQVIEGIKDININEEGISVIPATNDPQLLLSLTPQKPNVSFLRLSVNLVGIIILVVFLLLVFDLNVDSFDYVPYFSIFALAFIMVMAVISKNNRHPDEYVHVTAAHYYKDYWLPPEIGSHKIRDTYSAYGFSRLHTGEIVYFIAGKYTKMIEYLQLDKYLAARSFNIILFFILFVMAVKRADFRIFLLPVLLSPQSWYLFAYFNSDAFAIFLTLYASYQLAHQDSLLHSYLKCSLYSTKSFLSIFFGIVFFCLLLLKKNYFFLDLFLLFYFVWMVFFKKIQLERKSIFRICYVITIGFFLYGVFWLTDNSINNFQRAYKIQQVQEQFAHKEFKPSTPLEQKHPYLQMKNRGVSLKNITLEKQFFKKLFISSFGQYGYTSIHGSKLYYEFVVFNMFLLFAVMCIYTTSKGGKAEKKLMDLFLFVVTALMAAIIWHAWCADFQTQGRYLSPCLAMTGILLYHIHRLIPRPLLNSLLCSMYLISTYNFIYVGIYEIEKIY